MVRLIIFCVLQVWCYERGVLAGGFLKVVNFGQLERLENEPTLLGSIISEGNVVEKLSYFIFTMLFQAYFYYYKFDLYANRIKLKNCII